jgi:cell division protein FtsB
MGIFGFLSKAHLDQVKPTSGNNIKIELIDNQISQQELIITRSQNTLDRLDKALDVYIDKEYVSRGLKERKKQKEERDLLNLAIKNATDEIVKLTNEKATLELEQDKIEAEVGPIKYIAEMIYGDQAKEMFDHAVRIVILILIFVFDPLAVLLLIAANISLNQWRMKRNLTTNNAKEALAKRIEKLEKRNKKLRGYQGFVNKLGYKELDGLDPDEIKLKIDQIMDWNDNEKNNTNN